MNKTLFMKQAPFLKEHDVIEMIAPSFGVTTEPYSVRYDVACRNFKKLGFTVKEGKNVHLLEGVVASASPEARAEEFLTACQDESALILSVGGGELMDEMLPFIPFSEMKSLSPKWFMGFSDNTNLTYPLTTLLDWITIYGPCTPSFYEWPLRLNQADAIRMLKGEKEFQGYAKWAKPNFRKKPDPLKRRDPLYRGLYRTPKVIVPYGYQEPFEGRLLGGCLDCLQILVGTRFDGTKGFLERHPEGVIWYLEACDLNPLGIRRALFSLKEAGWFDTAKGFLIGRPLCWDATPFGLDRFKAVEDILGSYHVPILFDVDLGHYPPSLPMKNGAMAQVTYQNKNMQIQYLE